DAEMNSQIRPSSPRTPDTAGKKSPLLPVEEARRRIVSALELLPAESVSLEGALGRIAASNIQALISHPAAPVSAMDGYALSSADVQKLPVRLRKVGESKAGTRFMGNLEPGTCVRIFTGGIVPDGADIIALQEDASEFDEMVEIREVPQPG